jgi:hypothetical protein
MVSILFATGLMLGSQVAQAAEYIEATVYRTSPNGVWLRTSEGTTWVPSSSAIYRVGDSEVTLKDLSEGRKVNVYYVKTYTPHYLPDEYYSLHPDWDWEHHWSSWQQDQSDWYRDDTGHWQRR